MMIGYFLIHFGAIPGLLLDQHRSPDNYRSAIWLEVTMLVSIIIDVSIHAGCRITIGFSVEFR